MRRERIDTLQVAPDDVALAALGADELGANLLAQACDQDLDRIALVREILAIDMLGQFALADNAPPVVHQIAKGTELKLCQPERAAVALRVLLPGIEKNTIDLQDGGGMSGGTPDDRAQAGQHLLHLKWFCKIVVRAGIDAVDLVAPAIACGQRKDGHMAASLTPPPQDRHAIEFG